MVRVRSEAASPIDMTDQREAAFEVLFHENWEKINRVAYQLCGDPAEAQDLALEAFLRLHHQAGQRIENPSGWLYQTVTRLGYNALRARKRRDGYEIHSGREAWSETRSLEDELEQREQQARVRAALARLKQREAQLLVLRYSGLSYAEAAAALALKPSSVGTLLARAEKQFEKIYRKLEGSSDASD